MTGQVKREPLRLLFHSGRPDAPWLRRRSRGRNRAKVSEAAPSIHPIASVHAQHEGSGS